MNRLAHIIVAGLGLAAVVGCSAPADDAIANDTDDVVVARDKREAAVAGAKVWDADEFSKLASKDLARGQAFENAPVPGSEIVCKFVEPMELEEKDLPGGKTTKFLCNPVEAKPADAARGAIAKQIKIKYSGKGRPTTETNAARLSQWRAEDAKANGEVFSEAVGTRLMWALGFYADGIYPVKVRCYGCPENPFESYGERGNPSAGGARADRDFYFAAAEIKIDGKKIEDAPDSGFNWETDLPRISEARGGASKTELEAWKLFAAFMFHGDNKAANQRLFCAKGALAEDGTCTAPRAMIQDIGASLGSAGSFFGLGYKKAELGAWEGEKVWKDLRACRANLSSVHQLKDPVVSDAGRQFLYEKMSALTDEQLKSIFEVSRIAQRGEKNASGALVTADDWVRVFKAKREELGRTCR